MKQQPFRFFYRFTKSQRRGVLALFLLIFVFQGIYFVVTSFDFSTEEKKSQEEKEWLSVQSQIDELKLNKGKKGEKVHPFNPNFISDYKGYMLGMTTAEIDRLHAFRAEGRFVNTVEEFRQVTKVRDSILNKIAPYFKFPLFAQKGIAGKESKDNGIKGKAIMPKVDINQATEEDLVRVRGIGTAYAQMILRRRTQLGGFVSTQQFADFSELPADVIVSLSEMFEIRNLPQVNKINVNTASLNQLSRFPYFTKNIAKGILTVRSMKGKINNIEELLEINGFPIEKKNIIALYLEF